MQMCSRLSTTDVDNESAYNGLCIIYRWSLYVSGLQDRFYCIEILDHAVVNLLYHIIILRSFL